MAALAGSHRVRGGPPGQYQPPLRPSWRGPQGAGLGLPSPWQPPGSGGGAPPPLAPLPGLRDLFVWCHLHKNRTSVSVRSNAGGEILIDVSVWSPRLSERFDLGCLCCLLREMRKSCATPSAAGAPQSIPLCAARNSQPRGPRSARSTASRLRARRAAHYDIKPGGLITSCQPVYVWRFPMLPSPSPGLQRVRPGHG